MEKRPHIGLNTSLQFEKPIKLSFNYGAPKEEERERKKPIDFTIVARHFRQYLLDLGRDREHRIERRNPALKVPEHIEYVKIRFQGQFDVSTFFKQWLNDFGLIAVNFSHYNQVLTFGSTNTKKFDYFLSQIGKFINNESGEARETPYDGKIRYVRSFELLTTEKLAQYEEVGALMNIKLVEFPLRNKASLEIFDALIAYFKTHNISYLYNEDLQKLEVYNATTDQLNEIVNNFDIVESVTSSLSTLIRPTRFNVPERLYGFDTTDDGLDLPIIGVLDTGVSINTPLEPLLIRDEQFNLTASHAFVDESNDGSGHGTAVAALAALGKRPYGQKFRGTVKADARILSMKIMDDNQGYISETSLVNMLYEAKNKYPSIKLFTLTVCYKKEKFPNEVPSTYAQALDKFAHVQDCLIFICTANNEQAANQNGYRLDYFDDVSTYLCSPAESMNNVTVGAAAGGLNEGIFLGISPSQEFPALYSRRSHIDLHHWYPKNKINKNHFKPDLIEFGGDFEYDNTRRFFGQGMIASMELLSANPAESFWRHIGTSFATPLVANTAARIQAMYGDINAQSIKALLVNGASLDKIPFGNHKGLTNKVAGHGLSDSEESVYSNPNKITFLIEDSIEPEQLVVFPLNFPNYLTTQNLKKTKGIVKITATLCFSFEPLAGSQLAYCPVHIAFCFFKNQTGEQILAKEEVSDSLLRSNLRWSQSGRYVKKPIPCSNTQKLTFYLGVEDLKAENSTIKLGVNCRLNRQLLPGQESPYAGAHDFSIAVTVEEMLRKDRLTGKLYDEMLACNAVEVINTVDMTGEGEAEA